MSEPCGSSERERETVRISGSIGQVLDAGRGGRGHPLYRSASSCTEGLPGKLKPLLQPEQFAQGVDLTRFL